MENLEKQKIFRFVYPIPIGILIFFLYGAVSGEISLWPIRGNEGLTIIGLNAWIACLAPLMWLVAEFVRHDPLLGQESKNRNVLSFLLHIVAAAFFLYSAVY